ncbi:Polyphosphoinositide phosphatase [Orchesella cincta]|uniref:Polyphosphoinositide phosphatase n=1 Tax=Orchesella cincta TaxID=48709 RepID=A0A1D2N2L1_ORCCI|nr:Polyphosphoinositide phosphatase [Orchesella cincta]
MSKSFSEMSFGSSGGYENSHNMSGNEEQEEGSLNYRPYFISIQKMVLYETRNRFYLVGSNQTESKFRILKIDRMEARELVLVEDQARYTQKEMKELLSTIACVNRPKNPAGLVRTVSAFGILGFVRFLEGYYIVLVTKRRKVATIGYHSVYKIEDTACIYIPCDGPSKNPDELRYLKLFQSIDLSSNFYFTYSYDLTNSLQYNLSPHKRVLSAYKVSNPDLVAGYGVANFANRKFVWNAKLLEPMETILHPDWILNITHGFIGQSSLCVHGKPIYLTLIARRSAQYAGTRFLKRGANFEGNVANEVETEQIVFDSSVSSFHRGKFTSFVQMRGSIPAHWSQDIAKMVPKPPIGIDLADPYAETAGKHFGELLSRFGSPIVVVNLVKKREKKRHESILTEEYTTAINTLNQFLPPKNRIIYVGFDMARINKTKEENVMVRLASISEEVFRRTGFFMSFRETKSVSEDGTQSDKRLEGFGKKQTGLVRINCVDCLDRTNTAQFALGKCALAHQHLKFYLKLRALGLLSSESELEFECDAIRMLEELYEDHGDTLALQYGGSQLVHRINTYRKTAPWTSQGNDIMQTLSRYFSNTFSDADKQNAINLFLGMFEPLNEPFPLWALESDLHLHLKFELRFTHKPYQSLNALTEWYPSEVLAALPYAAHELRKTCKLLPCEDWDDIDAFADFYRPRQFIPIADLYAFKVSHSVRDFMPNFTTDFSPFVVRIRPGKRQEENIGKKAAAKAISHKNPSIMGLSSTGSTNSTSGSDTDYSSSEEMSTSMASSSASFFASGNRTLPGEISFSKFFGTMKDSYGVELRSPRKSDVMLYKSSPISSKLLQNSIIPLSAFSKDSSFSVTPPKVSRLSRDIYKNYVNRGIDGASSPGTRDMSVYSRYVAKSGNPFQNTVISRPKFKV